MIRRSINLIQFWLTVGFFLLPCAAFGFAWYIRFHTSLFNPVAIDARAYFIFAALVTVLWAFVVERVRLNRIATILSLRTGVGTAAKACLYCAVLALSLFFFYRTVSFARIFVVIGCALLFVLSVALIHVFRGLLHAMDRSPHGRSPIAILGADEYAEKVARHLSESYVTRCRVSCFVALPQQTTSIEETAVLDWSRLEEVVDFYRCSEILICLPPEQLGRSQEILQAVQHLCIPARMVLNLGEGIFAPDRVFDYHGLPLLDLRPYPVDTIAYSVGKRVFDILFSAIVLLVGAPIIAVVAIAIKATSPGPVFFLQERISLNGRRFQMIKFRSMHIQESKQSDQNHTSRSDLRITAVGHFLRQTSLDEFPQFVNVLRGDMSVVGPRPELTFFVHKFRYEIPWYMSRHNVKCGITGWAQVNGLRGSDTSIERRIEYDMYYMKHWSMLFDLRIIFMTVSRGLISNQAY